MVSSHGVDLEEFDDAMHDTFAPKEKTAEKDEEGKEEETAPVPEAPAVENEMTFTE